MKRLILAIWTLLLALPAVASQTGVEQPTFLSSKEWREASAKLLTLPLQVVVIQAQQGAKATMALWEKKNEEWVLVNGPWPAVIGKNGMTPREQKKEGDGKTPTGLFPISLVFGEADRIDTGLPYRATTEQDIWVDDPLSPLYNQWSQLPTSAHSFEKMKRKDHLYKLGLVVDYNQHPVVAGSGSAIFIHIWRSENKGTAGCAALDESNLIKLVQTLKRELNPSALFLP
jgi:L,D-peptidoglycan transpeptidase YkuD (ErfK/YbiS/YcfS/YnhG family)